MCCPRLQGTTREATHHESDSAQSGRVACPCGEPSRRLPRGCKAMVRSSIAQRPAPPCSAPLISRSSRAATGPGQVYQLFRALDRLTASACASSCIRAYARRIRLDDQPLQAEDFKTQPGAAPADPEHGPGLRRLSGTQRPDRQDSRLADGPEAIA